MRKKWWKPIEIHIDEVVPVLLVVLILILIVEFFFPTVAEQYKGWIEVADWLIIVIFAIDLLFKYLRIRVLPLFLKKYWLDIIAIFPFFLVFRLFEQLAVVFGTVRELPVQVQKIVHIGLELKEARLAEEAIKVSSEAEEVSRTARFARFLGEAEKVPQALKPIAFYEDPKNKKELKKEVKGVEKEGEKLFKQVEKGLVDELRGPRRSKNEGKSIQRSVRSVQRRRHFSSKARKRV